MKNTDYEILPFFPKVFYIKDLDLINDKDYNNILLNCKKQKYITTNKQNSNSSKISESQKILDLKDFNKLKQIIYNEFNFFKNNILKYTNTNFKITSSWITKTEKNNYSLLHNHNNSMFSGIFYVSVNEKQLNISFENIFKSLFSIEPKEYNIFNSCEQKVFVKNKTLIFFPSEVHHTILSNEMHNDRYSIAFNILPTGLIGINNTDEQVNIKVV